MNEKPVRKRNRLPGEIYRLPGAYFITICTRDRKCLFRVNSEPEALPDMPLTSLGTQVEKQLLHAISGYGPSLSLEKYVIMPNHVHLLLVTHPDADRACPDIRYVIRFFKRNVSLTTGRSLWQKGFHDHIVRNDEEYRMIWKYIDENPLKWCLDKYFPSNDQTP